MKTAKECLAIALDIYKKHRNLILFKFCLLGAAVGYFVIGRFIVSDAYQWIVKLVSEDKLLSELIDIEKMIRDKLLASTLPFFIVWSCVLAIYVFDNRSRTKLNKITKHFSPLTGGTAFFTIVLGCTLFGTFAYALQHVTYSVYTVLLIVLSLLIIGLGFFLRRVMTVEIRPDTCAIKYAPYFLAGCIVISLFLYFYGLFSEPIQLYNTIVKHHAQSLLRQ
ncbi:hypothetical protein EDF87_10348 [Pseudomonas helmanticensis]|uniref:Uncharacterized protein n=1 Tax=Pseudomonas helmanticensis TaxID=1471381 RepID=A0A4V3FT92_9PSED|nr:hypothetical protein [Pseudomonas helmanticensis]TDV50421.1 hypothetical protein EDF87_10348 [Pseudomonas helmanticensis]